MKSQESKDKTRRIRVDNIKKNRTVHDDNTNYREGQFDEVLNNRQEKTNNKKRTNSGDK